MAKSAGKSRKSTKSTKRSMYKHSSSSRKCSKPSKCFIEKVQSIIHKQSETKQAFGSSGGLNSYNSGIDSSGDLSSGNIIPSISKNAYDYGRIGDQIRAQSLVVSGYVIMANDTSTSISSKRIACRLMVVSCKRFPTNLDNYSFPTWLNYLLKKGGTTTGFTGALSDLYAPINSDLVTKHHDRVFYLNQDNIFHGNAGSGTSDTIVSASLAKTVKFFKIKIPCKNKLLKYDDSMAGGIQPINFSPTIILGYCHLDGSSPDVATTQVSMEWTSDFKYEDF